MITALAVHRQALQFQNAPAEVTADRSRAEDGGLNSPLRDGDIGQGEEAAPSPKAGLGPVETEAVFAQRRPDETGADAKSQKDDRSADYGDDLMRHHQFL